MGTITMEKVKESNRLKEKACNTCMEKLNGVLSDGEMQQFREAFYAASEGYMFRKDISGQKPGSSEDID